MSVDRYFYLFFYSISVENMTAIDWGERWSEVRKLLERPGPFTHPDFEPSPETLKMLQENIKVLVIGKK